MKKKDTNIRQFEGVFIPKSILDSRELSPMLKFLLIEIKCLDNDFGCTANNAHLAERIASSPNSVSNMISELTKKAFIYVSYKDEKSCSGRTINVNQIKFYGIDPSLPQNNPTLKVEGGTPKVEGHTLKVEGGTPKVEHRKELEKKEEEKENESAHTQIFSEPIQGEEEKEKEKSCAKKEKESPAPTFNPKAKKVYESHLEIYDDLMTLYKTDDLRKGTLMATLDPLGINDQTPDKKIAFAEYVKDIYCPSIKLAMTYAINPLDIHDKVIQKIGFDKDKIKALKGKPKQTIETVNKTPQNQNNTAISKEYEYLILEYIEAKTNGEVKLKSISEIKPISREQRLMDMGLKGGEVAMRERIKTYKATVA